MKTFKQVFIKSEADLPEDGFYYAYLKSSNMICLMKMSKGYKPFWIEDVDWYLIEVPDNRDAIIEKQREIIKDSFYYTGYSNGKLKAELSALEAPPEDKSEIGCPFDEPVYNPACKDCGHQNSENCNTCSVIHGQFDGV